MYKCIYAYCKVFKFFLLLRDAEGGEGLDYFSVILLVVLAHVEAEDVACDELRG